MPVAYVEMGYELKINYFDNGITNVVKYSRLL